jgi:hypothetical protein
MKPRQNHAWPGVHTLFHLLCAVLVVMGWIALPARGATQPTRLEIGLIGDLPYSGEDEAKFPALMEALNEANLAFVVHVGDIESDPRGYQLNKTGMSPCTAAVFQ